MKNRNIKWLSWVLCVALCVGAVGATVYALNDEDTPDTTSPAPLSEPAETDDTPADLAKDETVYVLTGADGGVRKIIVSDWIQNRLSAASVEDDTALTNVENVKGDETYALNGDHMTVWDAQGNDIYYRGNIDKELPVGITISYSLDGAPISAADLAGKSGHVAIRFAYQNRQYEMVELNGQLQKFYVPFVMLTGMMLDNDVFRNVTLSNGKFINDGDRTIVIGFALPGMQENLGVGKDVLDVPDTIEIEADVTDFAFGMTVSVATNEFFNNPELLKVEMGGDLAGSLGEMTAGLGQLVDGSSQLYDGLCVLLEKSDQLVSGIHALAEGAEALRDGIGELESGAEQLQEGMSELYFGLTQLADNSAPLNEGARQVFDTLLATAADQIRAAGLTVPAMTVDNYTDVLTDLIGTLDGDGLYKQALAKVTEAVEENRAYIVLKVTEAVRDKVLEQVLNTLTNGTVSVEEYKSSTNTGWGSLLTPVVVENMVSIEMKSETVQNAIRDNVEQQVQKAIADAMASDEVQSQLAAASSGAQSIIALKTSLDSYKTFYEGLLTYTGGVTAAADGALALSVGAASLKDGIAQLQAGADQLYDGILEMDDGAPALVDGVSQLADGAMQLSEGLKRFSEEGIQQILTFLNSDLDGVVERWEVTMEVSKRYRNFAGIGADMDGQVRFIYRTDAIKAK